MKMLIGINEQYQIKQIGEVIDENLIRVTLDETAETYPFKDWSDTKIKCYCYKDDGNSVAIYPYVPTNIIEKMESQDALVTSLEVRLTQAESDNLTSLEAIAEVYEMLIALQTPTEL
jgi:hypothetical protein